MAIVSSELPSPFAPKSLTVGSRSPAGGFCACGAAPENVRPTTANAERIGTPRIQVFDAKFFTSFRPLVKLIAHQEGNVEAEPCDFCDEVTQTVSVLGGWGGIWLTRSGK